MTDPFADLPGLGFGGWSRHPLRGDASARQFMRLTGDRGQSAIAMHTPPALAASQSAFVAIAHLLRHHGIAAPKVLAETHGLVVMEDLGAVDLATALRDSPTQETTLYRAAIDVLLLLHKIPAPPDLITLTPDTGAAMLDPFFEFFATGASAEQGQEITGGLKTLLADHTPHPTCLSLRDYHAENLIWRGDRTGTNRIGVVDFQDAFLAPPEYDLVSLLRDARRDVSPTVRRDGQRYFANATGQTEAEVTTKAAVLGVQRNLRILGIFARLARRNGKDGYLALIPRVRQHIVDDLAQPALASLRPSLLPLLEPIA